MCVSETFLDLKMSYTSKPELAYSLDRGQTHFKLPRLGRRGPGRQESVKENQKEQLSRRRPWDRQIVQPAGKKTHLEGLSPLVVDQL